MITEKSPSRFTCVGCRIKLESAELQRSHFKTEWHLYNLKRKVCNLEPIDHETFERIQDSAKAEQASRTSSNRCSNSEPEVDEIASDDSDWEDETEDEMLARVIKVDVCLFCDKKSNDIKSNVRHMNLKHGFFIPEEQYLTDLEGLLEYLGFKVGAGGTCLWCGKQFSSVHGVRLHMIYKDHCKILYEHDNAIEEFKEFYDYSEQEQFPMKKLDQLVIRKSRRFEPSRSLVMTKHGSSHSKQLVIKTTSLPVHVKKSFKKFDSYRAKTLLRTGMANNETMRSRIRLQNPI